MKVLFVVVVLILIVAGLGFYRGWFQLSTDKEDNKSNVTFSVNKDKFQEDENKAKETVQDLGHKVKEKTSNQTGTLKEEDKENAKEKVRDFGP
jgi:predicted negative regulator of RcsB-dependent stress response